MESGRLRARGTGKRLRRGEGLCQQMLGRYCVTVWRAAWQRPGSCRVARQRVRGWAARRARGL